MSAQRVDEFIHFCLWLDTSDSVHTSAYQTVFNAEPVGLGASGDSIRTKSEHDEVSTKCNTSRPCPCVLSEGI